MSPNQEHRFEVLTADTTELQEFLLKHLKTESPLVNKPSEGWQHRNNEGMWGASVELQSQRL